METLEDTTTDTRDQQDEDEGMKLLIKMTRMTVKYFYEPKDLLVVDLIIKEKRKFVLF